ncbi:gas vesicle protein GvpG [Saccharomonospora sp. NPDC046836]|uniref:gas vesicle protein GvpG n=1 Tax=Saccharomonospora sp. NPDC046836 TaxID=3156921 RepID=UPI003400722F
MGLFSIVTGLPLAPVRGVLALGRVIQRQVETELHDPSSVRRDLEAAEKARAAGEIDAEQEQHVQQEALERLVRPGQDTVREKE